MNKQDKIQQEAIRNLAKISATRTGGFTIDPAAEQKEKDRISRLVDPNYKSPVNEANKQGGSPLGSPLQIIKFAVLIGLILYFGLSFVA